MSKTRAIISMITISLLLITSACGSKDGAKTDSSISSNTSESAESVQVQLPKEYTIYYMQMMEAQSAPEAKAGIVVKHLSRTFEIGTLIEDVEESADEQKKSFSISGKNYEVQFEKTRKNELYDSEDPLLSKCGIWYEYEGDNTSRVTAKFNKEGKLILLVDFSVDMSIDEDFSNEDAKNRAEEIAKELYGNDVLEKYPIIEIDRGQTTGVRVFFYASIAGRKAEEFIMIVLNGKGELCALNAKTMGYFDPLAKRITEEHIASAENKLLEAFPTYYIVDDEVKMIVIDAKGQGYICQNIRSEEEQKAHHVYINLE